MAATSPQLNKQQNILKREVQSSFQQTYRKMMAATFWKHF